MRSLAVVLSCLILAACSEDAAEIPDPVSLTDDAVGFYDQMIVVDHNGPKAQIHLAGADEPLWFSQVRDGVAYIKSAERTAEVLAFYVNDMAKTDDWADPGAENWINADSVFFVIGSDAQGGMGSPEIVPFGAETAAAKFADRRGGQIVALTDIDPAEVLVPLEMGQMPPMEMSDDPDQKKDHDAVQHDHAPVTQ